MKDETRGTGTDGGVTEIEQTWVGKGIVEKGQHGMDFVGDPSAI